MSWKRLLSLFVFLTFFLLAAAGAYLLNNRLGYTPVLFLALLPPADLACALLTRRCVKLRCGSRYLETVRGEKAAFAYDLENRSRLLVGRVHIVCRAEDPQGFRTIIRADFNAAPKSCQRLQLGFAAKHVGSFRLTVRSAKACGPLGFFSVRIPCAEPSEAVILPGRKPSPEIPLPAANRPGEAPGHGSGADGSEYDGVRDYLPGDPLHRVHWKLTAHRGTMMTRICRNEEELFAEISADLRPVSGPRETAACVRDCLCETACAAASACLLQGAAARLVFLDGAEPRESIIRSEDDMERAAFLLAAAAPAKGLPPAPAGQVAFLAVSAQPDDGILSLLNEAAETGVPTVLYQIFPPQQASGSALPALKGIERSGAVRYARYAEAPARSEKIRAAYSLRETEAQV